MEPVCMSDDPVCHESAVGAACDTEMFRIDHRVPPQNFIREIHQVLIVHSSVDSNWVSFEHNSDIGHTFILNNQGANTRTDVELLWKQSPLQFAPNCKTPTLFIHSDEDYRCYMAEGLAMFSAIKRNGCPAKLCLFHGENHELSRGGKPENRIDRMTEIIKWMDEYLK